MNAATMLHKVVLPSKNRGQVSVFHGTSRDDGVSKIAFEEVDLSLRAERV